MTTLYGANNQYEGDSENEHDDGARNGISGKLLLKSGCVWKFEYHIKSELTS